MTHGDEGTHYACSEQIIRNGGCCGCSKHECRPTRNSTSETTNLIPEEVSQENTPPTPIGAGEKDKPGGAGGDGFYRPETKFLGTCLCGKPIESDTRCVELMREVRLQARREAIGEMTDFVKEEIVKWGKTDGSSLADLVLSRLEEFGKNN